MWRQQRRESRKHFDEGREYSSHDRGSYHDQEQQREERQVKERSRERYRDDYDTYNTNYGEGRGYDEPGADVGYADDVNRRDRRYWDTAPEEVRYRDEHARAGPDDRYRDDRGRFDDSGRIPEDDRLRDDHDRIPVDDRSRDDHGRIQEDDRYRDERGMTEEERYRDSPGWDRKETYDHREVRDIRDTDVHADHFESDRPVYTRDQEEYGDDRRDFARDSRDWGDDRPKPTEEWHDYRNTEEPYRNDRGEFRDDRREEYRDSDKGNYREEDPLRYRIDRNASGIDRDKFDHKTDNRRFADSDRDEFRNEPSRDRNGRNTGTNRAAAVNARPGRNPPQTKIGSKPVKRVDNNNKGKVVGQRNFGQRFGRQEQFRHSVAADKRKSFANNRKDSATTFVNRTKNEAFISPKSKAADHSGFSSGKKSGDFVGRNKPENPTKGHAGYNSRDKFRGKKTEIVVTVEQKDSPALKTKTQRSSGSDSKRKGDSQIKVKTEQRRSHSESEKSQKNSRDRESHDNRRNRNDSSQHAESSLEVSKLYGSFHEDDAISILADDDRFTHETRSYLANDKHSTDKKFKAKSDTKDLSKKRSSNTSASAYEDKYSSRRSGNTGRHNIKTESTRNNSKGSYRDRSRQFNEQIRSRGGKMFQPVRKPFHKFGYSRFEKRNENDAFRSRNNIPKHKSEQGKTREHVSPMDKDQALLRIGRTGAVLKDDRFSDRNETEHSGEGKRYKHDDVKDKNDSDRYKGRGIHSSNKVKRKYLWKGLSRRSNVAINKKSRDEGKDGDDDQSEHFSKFRNERDERDFNRRRSLREMRNQNDLGPSDQNQNQQIIFIPNPDYPEGPAPMLDQYGNALINPDLHQGSFQQQIPQPVQFIPSNLPGEAPPGTEYVFIPFVNDPSTAAMPDNTINVSDDKLEGKVGDQQMLDVKHEPNTSEIQQQEGVPAPRKPKPLSELQRYKLRHKLALRRKKLLEQRLEKRIWKRLILKKEAEDKAMGLGQAKPKPTLKRLSPPGVGTSRGQGHKRQDLDDVSADEYENVSDLEDITDDENGERSGGESGRPGERRQAFRKPGEPRLAIRNRAGPDTVNNPVSAGPSVSNTSPVRPRVSNTSPARSRANNTAQTRSRVANTAQARSRANNNSPVRPRAGNSDSWQFNDVRKVVERKAETQKRGKGLDSGDKSPIVKKAKVSSDFQRQRPRTPIKITVSNDQFIEEEDDDYRDNDRHEKRSHSRSEEWRSGSRESHHDRKRESERRDSSERGKYSKKHREDRDEDRYPDKRKESPKGQSPRWTENKRRGGKYDDKDYDRRSRKSRFSDADEPRGGNRRGQVTNNAEPRGRNTGRQGQVTNIAQSPNTNQMPTNFINNQSPQNFTPPFSQMSQGRNQFNSPQSLPFGFQQAGLGQPGMQMGNSDPSLPPVSRGPMNMAAFGQPNLAVNPDMSLPPTVGPVAGASSMILPSNNFSHQNLQAPLQMQQGLFPSAMQTTAMATQQQQQVQQMTPSLLGVGPVQANTGLNQQNIAASMQGSRGGFRASNSPLYQQSQLGMSSHSGNLQQQQSMMGSMVPTGNQPQQAKHVMLNNPFVAGQQGFLSGQSKSKDSYMPANLNEVVHNVGPGKNIRPQGRNMPQNKPQIFGSTRGGRMHQIPRDSVHNSGIMRQKTGVQRSDNRAGKRANDVFISQPGPSGYSGDDIDEEIGELLCMKCDKVLLSESVMRRHAKWHVLVEAGVDELRCDTCQQGFTSSVAFNVHMRERHTGTTLKCDHCDLTFTNSMALTRHNRAGIHHK